MKLPNALLRPHIEVGGNLSSLLGPGASTGPEGEGGATPEVPDVPDVPDVVAVPFSVDDGSVLLGPGADDLSSVTDVDLLDVLEHRRPKGHAGEVVEHPVLGAGPDGSALTVLMIGVGQAEPAELRRAGAALARRSRTAKRVVTTIASMAHDAGLRAFVEGLVLGSFRYDLKTPGSATRTPDAAVVVLAGLSGPAASRQAVVDRGLAAAEAGWSARTLALIPSNLKSPAWLADLSADVAQQRGLSVRVWDEKALAEQGFGGLVGVGQASANPPRLVQLSYTPATHTRRTPHVVLVGKGITFDTGGLSIKPSDAMMNMKRDMTGAAVVLSVMEQLAAVGCPVRVTGLLACAENSISGSALRPGDVIRHYGGRTSEVTNTDAEGRLVMADALAYAAAELKPSVLVDVATLTGAMKIALGQRTGGLFANDDTLADLLLTSGRAAGEPLWRMPLVDDYVERLESEVADADNAAGGPGAITAALFLQPFTAGLPWAHLDLASAGDWPVDAYEWTAGASGFGARALLHWLELRKPLEGVSDPGRTTVRAHRVPAGVRA